MFVTPVPAAGDRCRLFVIHRPITSVPPAEYRPSAATPKAAPAQLAPAAAVRRVVLAEPSANERAVLKDRNKSVAAKRVGRANPAKSRPLVIGFPRALPADARTIVLSDLTWQALADGSRAARIEITRQARPRFALRLRFRACIRISR